MIHPVTALNRYLFSWLFLAGVASCILGACKRDWHASPGSCSNTDYGHGVHCLGGAGAGGDNAGITSKTVSYVASPGLAVIAAAYTCADAKCQNAPKTLLRISDNLNDPELCFVPSPHSPFALAETSVGTQRLQEYIWMCPSIPSGVTSFTATCSSPNACSYITLTVTGWVGLAESDVFDVDGGGASSVQESSATLHTSSATRYTNELIYTFLDNTGDRTMTPMAPHRTALQFWPGNINTAAVVESPGPQSITTTWQGQDDWYGAVAAIKSATSRKQTEEIYRKP